MASNNSTSTNTSTGTSTSSNATNVGSGNDAQLDWDSLPEPKFEASNKLDHIGFSGALNALVASAFDGNWTELTRSPDHESDYTVDALDILIDFLAATSQQVLKNAKAVANIRNSQGKRERYLVDAPIMRLAVEATVEGIDAFMERHRDEINRLNRASFGAPPCKKRRV